MSIATTSQWKEASGERREETEWHRVVMYNRLAEIAGEYLKKGRSVYIEGRLKTRKWQDGTPARYSTEIVADQMQMLGGREAAKAAAAAAVAASTKPAPAARRAGPRPAPQQRPLRRPPRPAAAPTWRTWTTIFRSERHTVAFQTRQVDDLPGFYCPDERRTPVHIPVGKAVGSLWKRCIHCGQVWLGSPSLAKT